MDDVGAGILAPDHRHRHHRHTAHPPHPQKLELYHHQVQCSPAAASAAAVHAAATAAAAATVHAVAAALSAGSALHVGFDGAVLDP